MYEIGQVLLRVPSEFFNSKHVIEEIKTAADNEHTLYKLSGYGVWFQEKDLNNGFIMLEDDVAKEEAA